MADQKIEFAQIIADGINEFIKAKGIEAENVTADSLHVETPPKPEMGDLGVPLFTFAKIFRSSPQQIAQEVAEAKRMGISFGI